MHTFRAVMFAVLTLTAVLAPWGAGSAAVVDAFPVCIAIKRGGLGAPGLELTLIASPTGSFFQLTGQAQFSQPIAPPNGLVTYGVNGTAIPNDDGFWVSLMGIGYDLAKTPFVAMIGMQLSADAAKNTLTYAKQSLDAGSTQLVTGVPEIKTCP